MLEDHKEAGVVQSEYYYRAQLDCHIRKVKSQPSQRPIWYLS